MASGVACSAAITKSPSFSLSSSSIRIIILPALSVATASSIVANECFMALPLGSISR
ncbi:Uncharacterised protein [Legionella pneumophila]|nr:Uncharacterised protein [Legionella pneumophila]